MVCVWGYGLVWYMKMELRCEGVGVVWFREGMGGGQGGQGEPTGGRPRSSFTTALSQAWGWDLRAGFSNIGRIPGRV